MPFKLINASAIFQRYISQVLRPVLEKEVIVYLNDILIISETRKKHKKKIKKVLKLLQEINLLIKKKKCKFMKKELKFLKYILFKERIEKDSEKLKII